MGLKLKKFENLLVSQRKIALDSSCFIYHIEENPKYVELTKIIFEELLPVGRIEAIATTLVITEILTKPYSHNRQDLVLDYRDLILGLSNFSMFAPDEQICDNAAQIRSRYGFKTPDAIHLATAIEENASVIVGNDRQWKRIKEIAVLVLDDYC